MVGWYENSEDLEMYNQLEKTRSHPGVELIKKIEDEVEEYGVR
ncbi:MAG: hypothetical protein P9M06_00720 [Candidatus Saelkia tenebricola]|nr:hypothetical protein [Candidatus Saelkia tenebricola]